MQRTPLRPLRLLRLDAELLDDDPALLESMDVKDVQEEALAGLELPAGEHQARRLLKRTPVSYLINQAYGLWFFLSSFLLTVIITHKVNPQEYGVYTLASTAFNTIAYIVAFGLEDALTTYVPRLFAEHGLAAAASLVRRLLLLRTAVLLLSFVVLFFGMPLLATIIALIPISGSTATAAGLRDPVLLGHIAPIAFFVLGNGLSSLFTAVCASLMRMKPVFFLGCVTQLLILLVAQLVIQPAWGADGFLWLMAISSLVNAAAFAFWLIPLLLTRSSGYQQKLAPVVHLGISAWLTNLATGALLKQISVLLLVQFAFSVTQIGYFSLSFQLAHAANLLLVTGFAGVSNSALAAAFVGQNYARLARTWQTIVKIETLLAAPALVFCLFNAPNIALILYGHDYEPVGPLLGIFLFFNLIVRILGTTTHQPTLYVMGKARLVVVAQWVGLLAVFLLGLLLIPHFGPAGALVADGVAQIITGGMLLAVLWRPLPRKYPLRFTLLLLLALVLAALPSILWHPTSRILLVVSGCLFLGLCLLLLLVIRPLDAEDLEMIKGFSPRLAPYLNRFARTK